MDERRTSASTSGVFSLHGLASNRSGAPTSDSPPRVRGHDGASAKAGLL